MLLRMQIPACSHGGSHFALGSKTNPTATPRGASERAALTLTRTAKEAKSTVEPRPAKLMFRVVLSLNWGEDATDSRWTEMELKAPYEHRDFSTSPPRETTTRLVAGRGRRGGAGRVSCCGGWLIWSIWSCRKFWTWPHMHNTCWR